jgi:hypothetical protein
MSCGLAVEGTTLGHTLPDPPGSLFAHAKLQSRYALALGFLLRMRVPGLGGECRFSRSGACAGRYGQSNSEGKYPAHSGAWFRRQGCHMAHMKRARPGAERRTLQAKLCSGARARHAAWRRPFAHRAAHPGRPLFSRSSGLTISRAWLTLS